MKRAFIRLFGCILSAIGLSMSYDTTMTVILGEDAAPGAAWAASGSGDTGGDTGGWLSLSTGEGYMSGTCVAKPDEQYSYKYKYQRWYVPYYAMVMGEGEQPSSATASLNEPYNPSPQGWSGYLVSYVYISAPEGGDLCNVNGNGDDPGVLDDLLSQYGISGTGKCFSIRYGDSNSRYVYYSPMRSAFERMGCQYVNTNGEGMENYTGIGGTGSGVSAYCYFSEASTSGGSVGHAVLVRRIFERCGSHSYWPSSSSVSIVPEGFWMDTPGGVGGYASEVDNELVPFEQGCPENNGRSTSWSSDFGMNGNSTEVGEYFCDVCPTYSKTSDLTSYSNLEYKSNGGTGITSCKINLVGNDSIGTFVYSPDCGYTQ